MNENILYPSILIIVGVLISSMLIIFLTSAFHKITRLFELYPESKGILDVSLKFISWFTGLMVFLLFFRLALKEWGLEFTTNIIEEVIRASPKYVLAMLIILCGFYISRIIHERADDYNFEFKNRMLLVIDFIVHMTFIFTALYSIGVNIVFFVEFYRVILWTIGAIIILVISMTIGIPLGITIYEKMKRDKRKKRRHTKY